MAWGGRASLLVAMARSLGSGRPHGDRQVEQPAARETATAIAPMLRLAALLLGTAGAAEACGDGPPDARVPCGPGECHDSPIGDICEGQECGYHNVTEAKIRAPNFHVMGTTCAENDPNGAHAARRSRSRLCRGCS